MTQSPLKRRMQFTSHNVGFCPADTLSDQTRTQGDITEMKQSNLSVKAIKIHQIMFLFTFANMSAHRPQLSSKHRITLKKH